MIADPNPKAKKAQQAIGKAERAIKALIVLYILLSLSSLAFESEAKTIITAMVSEIPKGMDVKPYADGMWRSALKWKRESESVRRDTEAVGVSDPEFAKDPVKAIEKARVKAKLAPTTIVTKDLATDISKKVLKIAQDEPLAVPREATKPLDAWGAAESEVRGEEQTKMVGEWIGSKGDLGIISVHLNCSDRCFPDQGKIVSKTLPAVDASLWTGKTVDGRKVYSWPAMHARVDKYGYRNFIIDGFNCRHSISPYEKGDAVRKPLKAETSEVSEAEQAMRSMERRLRRQWQAWQMLRKTDPAKSAMVKSAWDEGIRNYESFSLKNGLDPQEWRCKTA